MYYSCPCLRVQTVKYALSTFSPVLQQLDGRSFTSICCRLWAVCGVGSFCAPIRSCGNRKNVTSNYPSTCAKRTINRPNVGSIVSSWPPSTGSGHDDCGMVKDSFCMVLDRLFGLQSILYFVYVLSSSGQLHATRELEASGSRGQRTAIQCSQFTECRPYRRPRNGLRGPGVLCIPRSRRCGHRVGHGSRAVDSEWLFIAALSFRGAK